MNPHTAYDYPKSPHVRRHGPSGYTDYTSYRDWLRDEFCYRCVFCLMREQWCPGRAAFHIDHLVAQAIDPSLQCNYDNLVYVCATCNAKKGDLPIPSPSAYGYGHCVRVESDGSIIALNIAGEMLIDILRLDDPTVTAFRRRLLATLRAICTEDSQLLCADWLTYPDELPDLAGKRPPHNSRPGGVRDCAYERRKRGELPSTY